MFEQYRWRQVTRLHSRSMKPGPDAPAIRSAQGALGAASSPGRFAVPHIHGERQATGRVALPDHDVLHDQGVRLTTSGWIVMVA
jgi:hypothetical protein